MRRCYFAVASLLCLISLVGGFSIQTRVPIGYNNGPPPFLAPIEIDRYTDDQKGYTAIKDKKFKSCFIKEFDPFWNPKDNDKVEIMAKTKSDTIDTEEEAYRLRKKTGEIIAKMCEPVAIFWATTPSPPIPAQNPARDDLILPPLPNGSNRVQSPDAIPVPDTDKLPLEMQERIHEQFREPTFIEPPKINPDLINEAEEFKTPPPLEIYRQNHPINNLAEIPPPIIGEKGEENLIRPPIMSQEKEEEMLVPPPPMMLEPHPKSDIDELGGPPPLDVWRRMLANIKRTTTLEPPAPDMRSPDFKPGMMIAPPKMDQPPPRMDGPHMEGLNVGPPEMLAPPGDFNGPPPPMIFHDEVEK